MHGRASGRSCRRRRSAEPVEAGLELGLDRVRALAERQRDLVDREVGVVAKDDRGAHLERQVGDAVEERDAIAWTPDR